MKGIGANSQESSLATAKTCSIVKKNGYSELSVYAGDLTDRVMVNAAKQILKSFPTLNNDFIDILIQRIKQNGFSDKRLMDAVNHVIDNCVYPSPTVAQFISFDKVVKIYTYDDVMRMINEVPNVFETYKAIRLPNAVKPMYVHINDFTRYNLAPWHNKSQL